MCGCLKTIRKGVRNGKLRYFCKTNKHWFCLNRRPNINKKQLLVSHLDGLSFRSLASQYQVSQFTTYTRCLSFLKSLPHCADITRKYCSRFCGILLVDGKYVAVKGYDRKIPVIYGVDYLTHDIPTYLFTTGENYQSCLAFFKAMLLLNYPLQGLVCDENSNIIQACLKIYPRAIVQICTNHYKEKIRQQLQVRTDPKYQSFMKAVESIFAKKRSWEDVQKRASGIMRRFGADDVCIQVMADIHRNRHRLFAHIDLQGIPNTTNLIECLNSHLQGRLKTIKGFETFKHADLWLNGYFLRRRTKPFTDCTIKFKYLNGKKSLEKSKNPILDLPTLF